MTLPPPTYTVSMMINALSNKGSLCQGLVDRMAGSLPKAVPGFCSESPGSAGAHIAIATTEEGSHGKPSWPLGANLISSQITKAVMT